MTLLVQLLSIETEGFDAKCRNLGNHQHYNRATAHGQNNASQVGRPGKRILTGSESESLAKTSRICLPLTVEQKSANYKYIRTRKVENKYICNTMIMQCQQVI